MLVDGFQLQRTTKCLNGGDDKLSGGAAATTRSHLIHLGLSCQSWYPLMSTSTSHNVELQHMREIHGCISISSSVMHYKSYLNRAAGSTKGDKGVFEWTLVLLFGMIFITDHYGREQTKKIMIELIWWVKLPTSRPPLGAPGIAKGDICTPHDGINILKLPPLLCSVLLPHS